jgi:hypothetical protein
VTKLFTIQNCFKADTFVFSFHAGGEMIKEEYCRQDSHLSTPSQFCSQFRLHQYQESRESVRLRLHPFHRIRPLLKLRQNTNISRQRLQIRDLIAPNPTAVRLRQRSSTGGNSTFTRRTQGRNRFHTWTFQRHSFHRFNLNLPAILTMGPTIV